jgi:hypothetical protein
VTTDDLPTAPPLSELVDDEASEDELERLMRVDALLRTAAAYDVRVSRQGS